MFKNFKFKLLALSVIALFACNTSKKEQSGNSVTFVVEVPEHTPKNKSLFLSGNFEDWSGGKEDYKLQQQDDKFYITLKEKRDKIQYKFTLGSWGTVERDAKGRDIQNRNYTFKKPNDTIKVNIESWVATTENSPLVLPENVVVYDDSMYMPQLNLKRRIWVYTPPDYKVSNKAYPVLYMHDGQNLFTEATGYNGEWQVDEILNGLKQENGLELIVVGIDHGGKNRLNKMSPWENPEVEKPQGDLYLDFIVNTLKPKIDSSYRTKPDKANTAMFGASMGGLISHYAAIKHNGVFGKVGVFSPSLWISEKAFTYTKSRSRINDTKIYMLIGTDEGDEMLEDTQRMAELMKQSGFPENSLILREVEDGEHNETLWREYFSEAVCWLFNKPIPKKRSFAKYITANTLSDTELDSGKLMRIEAFPSVYIQPRPVDIWLPDSYSEDKKYNVLYMHDGQMLFDAKTTWNKQEWKVDEWASQLMKEGKTKDFIVVAIHHISEIRWQDLFPQKAMAYMKKSALDSLRDISGKADFKLNGDNYLKFLVKDLKPYIDNMFSTLPDRKNTYVAGSSMGGLMSMYAISEYPDIFKGAACISTHWVGARPVENNPYPEAIFKYMEANLPKAGDHMLYFDYGNKTLDEHYPQYAPFVDVILKQKGYTKSDSRNVFFKGTDHSENSWNQRLDKPLLFLLGNN